MQKKEIFYLVWLSKWQTREDVRRLKMTLKTLEITWVEACCLLYTDATYAFLNLFLSSSQFP